MRIFAPNFSLEFKKAVVVLRTQVCRWWLTLAALLCWLNFFSRPLCAQIDNVGAGHSISFDGVDDYIDVGNIYDDLTLPFTISAWVYVDPTSTLPGPVFASQDNADVYNGFWFFAAKSEIIFEYGDGFGANSPAYRQGKKAPIPEIQGKWTHVCGVMRSTYDVQVFINGINVGGNTSGSSPYPMSSNFPGDVAKIGYFLSNGIVYRYKGLIDELRIFNRALSESEIRDQMCKKLNGNESGLIGYWTFDELSGNTLTDISPNHFDGVLKGNPMRVFSGAPIGDVSTNLYSVSWADKSLLLDELEVEKITGNPEGVHIYRVNTVPSQTSGLSNPSAANPYYGVFIASLDAGNSFDIGDNSGCDFFTRDNNSVPQWTSQKPLKGIVDRKEIVPINGEEIVVNLGGYKILCDQSSYLIESGVTDPTDKSLLWSTGETTPDITVTKSGLYSLRVSNGCRNVEDTVNVLFARTPAFELGPDETLCESRPRKLQPYKDPTGFNFKWQDGSIGESFTISNVGKYWVTVSSACGIESDTVEISTPSTEAEEIPNIITPNDDGFNQYFVIEREIHGKNQLTLYNRWGEEVYSSGDYKNDWDGGSLPSGVYFYQAAGDCIGERRGVLTISK